jgi:hypothetical protein
MMMGEFDDRKVRRGGRRVQSAELACVRWGNKLWTTCSETV